MAESRSRLDVVGLGALNVDYIASASSLTKRMADHVRESAARFERNVEGRASEETILAVIDQLGTSSLQTALGGSAWNTVFALVQMQAGVQCGYVGVMGEVGMLGLSFAHQMDLLGIDRQWVHKLPMRPSGMCLSYIDDGERTLLTCPGANLYMATYLRENREPIARYLAGARFAHVTSLLDPESPPEQLAVLSRAKELNPALRITFDPGHDWAVNPTAAVLGILRLADFVFVNFREFKALGRYRHGQLDAEVARSLLGRCAPGAAVLVTKRYDFVEVFRLGPQGRSIEQFRLALPFRADGVLEDATGAGDIFSAAVLAGFASRDIQVELGSLLGLSLARHKLQGDGLPALDAGFLQIRESLTRPRPRPSGVFLSHDGTPPSLEVREFLASDCGLVVFELDRSELRKPIADAMRVILNKCSFAVCVLTSDAATSDGHGRADQDVVHQTGVFQGRYGFGRVAMLVEDGCEVFSNAAGLIRLAFSRGQVDATFLEIERMLVREGLLEENGAR
ncbi:PfkB family carbohydrate kinase [Dactylosporangium sp. NPDC051541]|uniref:PfkB family carbohydrate kinase n=1 Tax=Dactylosporangium sp. NPDC051541 TaxID=3363977 RepID=UPI0037B3ED1A